MDETSIVVYTDGGSRGNPGPFALGVYVETFDKKYSQFLGGKGTNNEAEYMGIVFALKKARQLVGKARAGRCDVEVRSDSELVVSQLNGVYKVKEERLFEYFIDIWNAKQDFKQVRFVHIRREHNKVADALLNEELDRHVKSNRLFE